MINMAESLRVHSLIARAALHSRASAGWTQLDQIWHAGGREGGRGGGRRGGEGREGRGRGRAGEGRGGEGRGLSTLSTNQNLCDRGA